MLISTAYIQVEINFLKETIKNIPNVILECG